MKLIEISKLLTIKRTIGNMNVEITGIQMDSRKIEKGNLFICTPGITGFLEDRHHYANDAIKNGAIALVTERDLGIDVPTIIVNDARYAMAIISTHFYGYPSLDMKLIGITGTNGKTTTSYIIDKILSDYGYKTGLMGNNGVKINHNVYPTDINTQEPPILQRHLRKMAEVNTEYCVMEVSSQGLDMGRVLGCHFQTAIFTNLTQDHLDYHGTFEAYRDAKASFFSRLGNAFTPKNNKYAVLNADDPSKEFFRRITPAEVITYGISKKADVTADNILLTSKGTRFVLKCFAGEIEIDLNLVGRFNVYNALAGITATLLEGVSLSDIKKSLSELSSVDGRMEIVNVGQEFLVIVDYAHTPDALENALSTIKEFAKGKIITVFGCGGNRDKTKRPVMGKIANQYSDTVIITSDNPRTEDPVSIIEDIRNGMVNPNNCLSIVNRDEAIVKAINIATKDDIILIAGKGHEKYQILENKTIQFDDKEIAKKALSELLKK
ncbi:UDP-N-acetylmuramoylalanyl-D-glutamate--2,6-diaminopimelate ligase [Heyndrickxia shackletonii]|uniref:UDP-N-acetylmuramoyl-L-alanyl-D-glutamate--2,6-diaminopimelate ligase n=1 Tax=Heyndrickxia shackletonii TaxID=157838 RepID=A0A0Q3TIX6_9BACI|nr:UDP-N-acetylmuramoyl-L-alanyl-D-glutamate--2,6-diaminopimelate ligase [Heyndrickxia shackletonii]KQL53553.1 UDP-N-acetylmuramoylalanyl-D-glutamate--2,6-diaminopimelate ligase [Heyndrickxia shackletonii]NEY99636.1 UDP-N-acetylmuramoyl-L-alanyl-D-glutamate--2,6-diaminopimelate ligase [Heyndrickxia shackletonii]